MIITGLYIYPIKSLGGIAVAEAQVQERGFQYDRRYMLVGPSGKFITQRTHHQMALVDVAMAGDTLRVWHRHRPNAVLILPLNGPAEGPADVLPVSIWDSPNVAAWPVSADADRWFTAALGKPCRLVYMPDSSRRPVETKHIPTGYATPEPAVSFADGYPYLLIGQASLDDLNGRLAQPVEMKRFRPSIVVGGTTPYEEDSWHRFRVGNVTLYGVKPCGRCVLITIDPATGESGDEPLRTLTTYRRSGRRILFGQNVLPDPTTPGTLRVGQPVDVLSRRESQPAAS